MEYLVKIYKNNKITELKAEKGTNLLRFLRKNSIEVSSPCGGKGTCGKCKVNTKGLSSKISHQEKDKLGTKSLEKGFRLACYNTIDSDVEVYLDGFNEEAKIITKAKEREVKIEPFVTKQFVYLDISTINNQASDVHRIMEFSKKHKLNSSLELLRDIPETLRRENFKVTLGFIDKKLIFVESGDTTGKLYGIAMDIGTTTIAAYLLNAVTGEKLDVYSVLNPQRKFGADVLSRIDYTLTSEDASEEMNKTIVHCINETIEYFCNGNKIKNTDIYSAVFVGNTTMMHFLMNISAKNIATAPFIPVTTDMHKFKALDLGININPFAFAVLLPAVSGYIGADTVAAVLSSGMHGSRKTTLLIDIGTNGEIVLGNYKCMYACSVAAGPAFEGANIRNGVGGIKGAIDKVTIGNDIRIGTIGNVKAIGICGSGIVDAVAGMLTEGVIDETGRILPADENHGLKKELKDRVVNIDGMNSFLLLKGEECNADTDIAVTQKDVRELQNAKAAIAAGIKILVKHAGIKIEDIERVYLAGGFGSYINIESALVISLLPKELRDKIESIGNAAGAGAIECLLSVKMQKKAEKIKGKINYIELSTRPDFVDEYIECMMFEGD